MSICRFSKDCPWYIYPTMFEDKEVFAIHYKKQIPLFVSLKDLKILVKEVSEDLSRYER